MKFLATLKYLMATGVCALMMPAQADDWYAGVQYSRLDTEMDVYFDADAGFGYMEFDAQPVALNLTLGNHLNDYFAVEALLGFRLKDNGLAIQEVFVSDGIEFVAATDINEGTDLYLEMESVVGISGVGILPVTDQFRLYGKLGLTRVKYDLAGYLPLLGEVSGSDTRTSLSYGVGAAFDVTDQWGVNLEYTRYPTINSRDSGYDPEILGNFDASADLEADVFALGVYWKI